MDVLQSLFAAYWNHARVFAEAHAILMLLVTGSLYNFARWKFDREPAATIWQQFEIRSDYVHGLIGLFLIVGIAGTFLGLWDVASALEKTGSAVPAPSGIASIDAARQASDTITLLFRGISRAFPVGFVGLVLSFIGNLVVNGIESSKRREIERFLASVGDPLTQKLISVLDPVANLGTTIQSGLQPVIAALSETLGPMQYVMANQQYELRNAKEAIVEAAEALKLSGREISASVTGLKEMAETSRAAFKGAQELSGSIQRYFTVVMTKLDGATSQASEAFQAYHDAMATMAGSVTDAAATFRQFPAELRSDVTKALVDSYDEASESREKQLADLYAQARQSFQENMTNAMSGVFTDLAKIRDQYEETSRGIHVAIANAQNAMGEYEKSWSKEAERLREVIASKIDPGMRQELKQIASESLAALEEAARSGDAFAKSAKKTTADIERLYREAGERLISAAKDLGHNLENAASQLQSTSSRIATATTTPVQRRPGRMRRLGQGFVHMLKTPIPLPWRKRS